MLSVELWARTLTDPRFWRSSSRSAYLNRRSCPLLIFRRLLDMIDDKNVHRAILRF